MKNLMLESYPIYKHSIQTKQHTRKKNDNKVIKKRQKVDLFLKNLETHRNKNENEKLNFIRKS